MLNSHEFRAKIESHVRLAETIRTLFVQKEKKTLQWSVVVEGMNDECRGVFLKEVDLKKQCNTLF